MDFDHKKHTIDATGVVLGQLANKVALLLVGKSKPGFVRNLDCGDFVEILNADKVIVTGKKSSQKTYTRYSGYPGGIRKTQYSNMKPNDIVKNAVFGMLPNNKLKQIWQTRLTFQQ